MLRMKMIMEKNNYDNNNTSGNVNAQETIIT